MTLALTPSDPPTSGHQMATDLVPLRSPSAASNSGGAGAESSSPSSSSVVTAARRSSWNGILRSPLRSRQPTPVGSPLLRRVQLTRLRHIVAPPKRVFPLQMSDVEGSSGASPGSSPSHHYDTLEFVTSRTRDSTTSSSEERSLSAPCSPYISPKLSSSIDIPGGSSRLRTVSMSSENSGPLPPPPYPGSVELLSTSAPPLGCASATGPTTKGSPSNGSFFVTSAPTGVSGSYPFQEIREIMVNRFEDGPFGMKVGRIGDGYYITHVVRDSAACCAGLKVGDEIVRVNDRSVDRLITDEVLQMIRDCDASVKLAYKPRAVISRVREVCLHKEGGVLGLRLQRRADGLYIDFVKSGTPASSAGLKDGDQVLRINSQSVAEWTQEKAMQLLKHLAPKETLLLCIRETLPLAHVTGSQPVLAQLAASYSEPASPMIASRNAC